MLDIAIKFLALAAELAAVLVEESGVGAIRLGSDGLRNCRSKSNVR
jgi:hypothetical protein